MHKLSYATRRCSLPWKFTSYGFRKSAGRGRNAFANGDEWCRVRSVHERLAEASLAASIGWMVGTWGLETTDLYRVNFEVNDSKPFTHLDFPHFKDLKTAEKCLVLMAN